MLGYNEVMQLTPQKIAAIKALADDERGEPNTRAAAKAKLEQYRAQHPEMFVNHFEKLYEEMKNAKWGGGGYTVKNPPNPRTQPREDYSKWRFMDMGNWKESSNGNYYTGIYINGTSWNITIFRHKKTPTWGWVRRNQNLFDGVAVFSEPKFDTIGEAQRDAWQALQTA